MDLFVDLKVPAVGGSQWTTAERQREEKSLCGNDLQTLLDFCGSPQIDTVERVKGIEPSYEAWEAAVLPLNYTRTAAHYRHVQRALRGAGAPCAGWSLLNVAKAQVLDFHVVIHAVV